MRVAVVVLDGWGLGRHDRLDAVEAADTPTFDRLADAGAAGELAAAGRRVGLPAGQAGNSEVGHLHLGAGRVVRQPYTRIDDAVAEWRCEPVPDDVDPEPWEDNRALAGALDHVDATGGRLHLCGLVSDGGVHADRAHLHALVELAADRGHEPVVHAFTDGRDAPPRSGAGFLADLDAVLADHGGTVATVCGRYYAMDRDRNWERTLRAYDAIVEREAPHEAPDAVTAVEAAYDRDETDEFVEPTLVEGGPPLADGDALVWTNFRGDRARQLVALLGGLDPEDAPAVDPPAVHVATMTEYDADFPFPVAFPPADPSPTLGATLADAGLTQLRVAESEKSAHVTYFLDGGREAAFAGDERVIVDSPDVPTYETTPGMSADAVTDAVVDRVERADRDAPDVAVVNYANPDMVGHTGEFEAAVAAVEAVDAELDRLAPAVRAAGGHLLLTADHGNADDMGTPDAPNTAHTTAPVPFVHVAPPGDAADRRVREGGSLADVAPTLLDLAGVPVPDGMTGSSLLVADG